MIALTLLLVIGTSGAAGQLADSASTPAALMAADRAFAVAAAKHGLEGWMAAFAPDAVRLPLGGKAVQGLPAVREADSGLFADSTRRLVWEPTDAGLFRDNRHGFTTGTSAFVRLSGGEIEDTLFAGRYITIWRLNDQGHWKVILDTGVTDPPQEP